MGIQTRFPTGDYGTAGGTWVVFPASPTTLWDKVDDTPADDDTTYIYSTIAGRRTFSFTAFSVPAGATINNITVYVRHKKIAAKTSILNASLGIWDSTDVAYKDGGVFTLTQDTWNTSSYGWTENPVTGLSWTVDEINGTAADGQLLAFGLKNYASGVSYDNPYCTQCYCEVNYTATETVTVSDNLTLTDSVETMTEYNVEIVDTLTLTDTITANVTYPVSVSDVLTLADATTVAGIFVASITDTLTLSDSLLTAQSLRTDHAYYLASSTGNIYTFSETNLSDAGMAIPSFWKSKRIDFADQAPDTIDKRKTLYKVRIHYEDLSANTLIVVHVSTDGGVTWTFSDASIGTGAGTIKEKDFFFLPITGRMFNFKVETASTANYCKVISLEAEFDVGGEHFEV